MSQGADGTFWWSSESPSGSRNFLKDIFIIALISHIGDIGPWRRLRSDTIQYEGFFISGLPPKWIPSHS